MFRLLYYKKQSDCIRAIEEDHSLLQLTNSDGRTIFHAAAYHGRLQIMEAINNIDAHMKDQANKNNITPLMSASGNDQAASVKWLLDHNSDVNIKSVRGKTALDFAREQKIKDMIKKK